MKGARNTRLARLEAKAVLKHGTVKILLPGDQHRVGEPGEIIVQVAFVESAGPTATVETRPARSQAPQPASR